MTKAATIRNHRLLCLVAAAAVVVASLLVALLPRGTEAAYDGTVTGEFGVNLGGLTVNSVVLYNSDNTAIATSMDPTSTYVARVSVTHESTLSFLDKIEVTVYYDEDGAFLVGDVPADGHAQNGVVLTWDGTDNWTLDDGTSTTWAIVTGECGDPTDLGDFNTYVFTFKFTVGTVAKESDDDTDDDSEWHIYAEAWDTGTGNDDAYQENLEMNFYGAITVSLNTGTNLTFGNLALGATDSASTNWVNGTYISNGNYNRNIRTDSPWSGGTYTVTLDNAYDGSPDNGEFCLEADDDNTNSNIAVRTTYVAIENTNTITSEAGDQPTGMTVWITLASTGVAADTYTGTVYYQISNR